MALPDHYVSYLSEYNPPWMSKLIEAMSAEPTVAVRYNRRKHAESRPDGCVVPWCDDARLLPVRLPFTFDPALHQGAYYVQDPSSMFVGHVVRQLTAGSPAPLTVLDACAAPGGKTTAVIDALPDGSHVVANEFVPKRAAVLKENLAKWGYPLVCVTQGDTSRFRETPGFFDLVVADVPCSVEGMMRKDAEAVAQWSPGLVKQCSALQKEIVDNLWLALKPGGYMVYSTCTFNPLENERMLAYMRQEYGAEPVTIPVDPSWNIAPALEGNMPAYRFIPGLIQGEGLFMGVVRKPLLSSVVFSFKSAKPKGKGKDRDKRKGVKSVAAPKEVADWLLPGMNVELHVDGAKVMACLTPGSSYPAKLELGELKGRDVVPSQQLALSDALNAAAFPQVDVDRTQALEYLRCEAISLPADSPRGFALLTYAGLPLGFVKNIGNRANNLYPRPWRILSQLH